jgi:biopolymer transport protein ExbD
MSNQFREINVTLPVDARVMVLLIAFHGRRTLSVVGIPVELP